MAGGKWHLVDLGETKYSYNFRVVGEEGDYYLIERIFDGEVVQKLKLLKLAPHIKLFIGLMSTPGAGKSSVAAILGSLGVNFATSHKRVSDALKDLGVDEYDERDALQGLGSYLGANYPVVWINQLIKGFNEQEKEVVIWDGMRFPHDVILSRIAAGGKYSTDDSSKYAFLKENGRFEAILVDADEKIRSERSKTRARPGDPTGLADFYRQDFNDRRVFLFDITRGMASIHIENSGTSSELLAKVNYVWQELCKTYGIQTGIVQTKL